MSAAERLFVKICGITRPEDALAAGEAGADAIGINFFPGSSRYVGSLERARAIVAAAPSLLVLGVFVNAEPAEVARVLEVVRLAQLHGDESPAFAERFPGRVVRAVRARDEASLAELTAFRCPFYLLDAWAGSAGYGGLGRRADLTLARAAAARARIVLAGGLDPDNVREAVLAVRPYGVDVASGVETAPGIKDADRMRRFVEAARAA